MPKSSFQAFSDITTKVVGGYVENKGDGGGKVATEKVENVMGSVAGAGSGEFHMYLNSRNREKARLDGLDQKLKDDEEARLFQEKVASNKLKDDTTTKRNALKRSRQKAKKEEYKKKARTEEEPTNDEADT